MADYWGQLTDPASVYESIYGEPFVSQAPSIVTPGGGRVTGYQDDPSISGYTPGPKVDRSRPSPSYYDQTPSIITPAGGRVTAFQDDPSISGYTPALKQDRIRPSPKVEIPNQYPGPTPVAKSQDRLPALPAGLPIAGGVQKSPRVAGRDSAGSFSGTFADLQSQFGKEPSVIKLTTEPMSEVSGQNTANSFGKPVQGPSGKTYYPSNTPMSGVRAPYDPKGAEKYSGKLGQDNRGPLSQLLGLKTSGLGGLLGGLFGGMQQSSGGGLGGLLGGGASHGITGVGGGGAFVAPQGSSLESTYGSGAVLPAAMNNERWTTGY